MSNMQSCCRYVVERKRRTLDNVSVLGCQLNKTVIADMMTVMGVKRLVASVCVCLSVRTIKPKWLKLQSLNSPQ